VRVGLRSYVRSAVILGLAALASGLWASSGSAATFTAGPTLTPPGSVNDSFGISLAADGNTLVVGASYETDGTGRTEGAASVYTQTSPGTWSNPQTLTGDPQAAKAEMFGSAVAIDGNTMVIGAPKAGNDIEGAAYVFTRSSPGAAWAYSQTLTASSSAGSAFGSAVAIDANTIVVGASQEAPSTGDVYGAAYVFTQPSAGAAFGAAATLTPSVSEESVGDYYGYAVAVSGQTVYVGAWNETVGPNPAQGAVHAYSEAGPSDNWASGVTETTLSQPPESGQAIGFGYSLAAQGNTLVVGADQLGSGIVGNVGAAFVYTVPTSGEVTPADQAAELQPPTAGTTEPFWGSSVAIDGATIVVGSLQNNPNVSDPYVYTEPSGGWNSNATGTLLPVTPDAGGVAVSGTAVLIGQPGEGDGDVMSFSQSATQVTLALSPASIAANGTSTSIATATVTDASGDRATAENVSFAANSSGVKIGAVTNNGDGTYSATVTGSTTAGAVTITATDASATPSISGQATLTQTSTTGSGGSGSGGSGSGGSGGSGSGGSGSGGSGSGGSGTPPRPPTPGQLKSSLSQDLAPSGKDGTLKAILKADGYLFTYKALEGGKLVINWYRVPAGAHVTAAKKKAPKPVLVGDSTARFSKAGKISTRLKLTASGKSLLKRSRKLTLTSKVSFVPTSGKRTTTSRTRSFTLK
jgi:Invasin, domain 3/FG-GAP repeat